jgi:release factor glutamine methyltransferase
MSSINSFAVKALLIEASLQLQAHSTTPNLDAELLLAQALQLTRTQLFMQPERLLSVSEQNIFFKLLADRCAGVPLSYCRGTQEFWSLELNINTHTLIPRPETELLVETALARFSPHHIRVADLGTGSGAIAIALATERPQWQIIATDQQWLTLQVAVANAKRFACTNIAFYLASWCDAFANESLDVIISNPPYIKACDPHLFALRYEPRLALVAGEDGLDAYRNIIQFAYPALKNGGMILLEHGYDQAECLEKLLKQRGFKAIEHLTDYATIPRAILGQK